MTRSSAMRAAWIELNPMKSTSGNPADGRQSYQYRDSNRNRSATGGNTAIRNRCDKHFGAYRLLQYGSRCLETRLSARRRAGARERNYSGRPKERRNTVVGRSAVCDGGRGVIPGVERSRTRIVVSQGYIWDTQSDMGWALVGALIALAILGRWHDRQLAAFVPARPEHIAVNHKVGLVAK